MNDADRLESVFKAYGDEIAAFLIEPIMGNCCSISATREFLQRARALCDRYGILMIIDEVKTGFRVARGGVQELIGVKADLCTFAKAMGNGYPITRGRGREDIMRKFGDGVVHGGTFTCHSVALAAAEKTLEILDETPALATIAEYGTKLRSGHQPDPRAARHPSFVHRPSLDERPVLQRDAAPRLPRLGPERLHFLRSAGSGNCTTSACSASRIPASPGSSARRTTSAASPRRCSGFEDGSRSGCSQAAEPGAGAVRKLGGNQMVTNYDAIVVGAGHNGLTNAAYLARAGLKVLVVERNAWIGGAAVSREIQTGWIYSNCSYVCSLLRPEIIRDLELPRHGLQVVPYGGGVTFTRDGDILGNYTDDARAAPRVRAPQRARRRRLRPLLDRRDAPVQASSGRCCCARRPTRPRSSRATSAR